MTLAIIINAILAAIVFATIVGVTAWSILRNRPATALRVAQSPEAHAHATRARAHHAQRAHAAYRVLNGLEA